MTTSLAYIARPCSVCTAPCSVIRCPIEADRSKPCCSTKCMDDYVKILVLGGARVLGHPNTIDWSLAGCPVTAVSVVTPGGWDIVYVA